jgi:ribose 5-phosphate isomerase B
MADMNKTIVIGSDHAGFPLKKDIIDAIQKTGFEVIDVGSYDDQPVDFPDIGYALCRAILDGRAIRGVMVCGTGVGAAIAANKLKGIRAAVCHDVYSAHQSVEHDNVNVICIGAKIVGSWLACDLIDSFLKAKFDATEDHIRRVEKLSGLENMD